MNERPPRPRVGRAARCALALLPLFAAASCSDHLLYVEQDHFGVHAAIQPENPSAPVDVSLGFQRGMVAFIPKQNPNAQPGGGIRVKPSTTQATKSIVYVVHDPNELMSIYSTFKANIGLFNPVEVHQFLATGLAAETAMANETNTQNVAASAKTFGNVPASQEGK